MLACVVCVLCTINAGQSVAFVSGDDHDDLCVFVHDLEARGARRVGPGRADGAPRWSADGQWLAFESRRDAGTGIYVVRHDGSEGTFLDTRHATSKSPAWSPRGLLLAYTTGSDGVIAVYDVDKDVEEILGDGRRRLMRPEWLPDSGVAAELAFGDRSRGLTPLQRLGRARSENLALLAIGLNEDRDRPSLDIFVITSVEAYPFPQLALASSGGYAEWAARPSPSGRDIAFESNDGGDREIFLFTRRGTRDASNHRAADWNPVWSPDGKWIAFESFRSGRRGIYRMHKETNRVLEVAVLKSADTWAPNWSSDGHQIAYVSGQTGTPSVFVADIQSGATTQLLKSTSPQYAPAWRPHPR